MAADQAGPLLAALNEHVEILIFLQVRPTPATKLLRAIEHHRAQHPAYRVQARHSCSLEGLFQGQDRMGRAEGSTRAMKPITREALRQFYLRHPMEPVPPETVELTERLQQLAEDMQHGDTHLQQLAERVFFETPTRIDDCGWRTRQLCEEAAHSLKAVAAQSPQLQVLHAGA